MTRLPAHRRRDPLDRAQLAPRVMSAQPDCACGRRHKHEERVDGPPGRCLRADCRCLAWRPVTAETREND